MTEKYRETQRSVRLITDIMTIWKELENFNITKGLVTL